MEENRKIFYENCRNTYEELKLRSRRMWKINASNQTNNQIHKHQSRRKLKFSYYSYNTCPPLAPSTEYELNPNTKIMEIPIRV
jgi:hypothetical protein